LGLQPWGHLGYQVLRRGDQMLLSAELSEGANLPRQLEHGRELLRSTGGLFKTGGVLADDEANRQAKALSAYLERALDEPWPICLETAIACSCWSALLQTASKYLNQVRDLVDQRQVPLQALASSLSSAVRDQKRSATISLVLNAVSEATVATKADLTDLRASIMESLSTVSCLELAMFFGGKARSAPRYMLDGRLRLDRIGGTLTTDYADAASSLVEAAIQHAVREGMIISEPMAYTLVRLTAETKRLVARFHARIDEHAGEVIREATARLPRALHLSVPIPDVSTNGVGEVARPVVEEIPPIIGAGYTLKLRDIIDPINSELLLQHSQCVNTVSAVCDSVAVAIDQAATDVSVYLNEYRRTLNCDPSDADIRLCNVNMGLEATDRVYLELGECADQCARAANLLQGDDA
jgi:hypothetical protein